MMKIFSKNTMIGHRESRTYIGTHILADYWGATYSEDANDLLAILTEAAHASNAEILGSATHEFEPMGTTAVVLLAESHISIHTWPEYKYVAIDVFTCGHEMNPELAIDYIEKKLKPTKKKVQLIKRGKNSQ